MTPDEAAGLLMIAAGYDPRHKAANPQEAEVARRIWGNALAEVPMDFARTYVERFYAREPDAQVKVAHVLGAWRTTRRTEDAKVRPSQDEAAGVVPGNTWAKRPRWFDAYLAACDEARGDWSVIIGITDRNAREREMAAARVRVQNVPLPVALVDRDQSREHRCMNYDVCACPHTHCHDGWLLASDYVTNLHGDIYEAVRRCPACFDVVLMRGELSSTNRGRR